MKSNPIKGYKQESYPEGSVTQFFGENPKLYKPWGLLAHSGIDIVAPYGTDLLAVEDGTIINVKLDPGGYGKHVELLSDKETSGIFNSWAYGHMSQIGVVVGEKVKAGDKLGEMGNTGFVISGPTPFWKYNPHAGTHLHLRLRKVVKDEGGWSYNKSDIKIEVLNYDNGYKGAIDPAPYFTSDTERMAKLRTIISLHKQVISVLRKLLAAKNKAK